jgi:multidrug efflux pump subunit AcrB
MDLADLVAANPGTRRVNFDWMEPERELHIRINQEQARQLGLSSQAVATASSISGSPSSMYRKP